MTCINVPDPGWGCRYGSGNLHDMETDEGVPVFMFRKGQRVRFFDADATQVGPEHRNVAPALTWAHYHGWHDPSAPLWLTIGCQAEARANHRGRAS